MGMVELGLAAPFNWDAGSPPAAPSAGDLLAKHKAIPRRETSAEFLAERIADLQYRLAIAESRVIELHEQLGEPVPNVARSMATARSELELECARVGRSLDDARVETYDGVMEATWPGGPGFVAVGFAGSLAGTRRPKPRVRIECDASDKATTVYEFKGY